MDNPTQPPSLEESLASIAAQLQPPPKELPGVRQSLASIAASLESIACSLRRSEMIGATVDRAGRLLFVSQFRAFVPASGTVALVDPSSGSFTPIEGTTEVFGLSNDPEADILYVGGYNTGNLYRLEETSPGVWVVSVEESFGSPTPPNQPCAKGWQFSLHSLPGHRSVGEGPGDWDGDSRGRDSHVCHDPERGSRGAPQPRGQSAN
jgi:hypothetical protein